MTVCVNGIVCSISLYLSIVDPLINAFHRKHSKSAPTNTADARDSGSYGLCRRITGFAEVVLLICPLSELVQSAIAYDESRVQSSERKTRIHERQSSHCGSDGKQRYA